MIINKRKNSFVDNLNTNVKKIKIDKENNESGNCKKRKSETKNENVFVKKIKIDDFNIIQNTLLMIEYGMCSKKLLIECKERYENYQKQNCENDVFTFINTFNTIFKKTNKTTKNVQEELDLYKLVYKIEKRLLMNYIK